MLLENIIQRGYQDISCAGALSIKSLLYADIPSSFYTLVAILLLEAPKLTTVTVDFKGTQEKILKEMIDLGIVKTRAEALRLALMNFALTTGLLSKEKLLEEIHERASSMRISEDEVQRMIERAKEKSIRR